jgi:hypothetical protein
MFIGHYAVAIGAKKLAPQTSLGTLLTAATFVDLLWPIFLLLGWERVRIAPGTTAFTPLDFESYPISHSLLTGFGWALLFGGCYWIVRRYSRGAAIIAALVVSHWILDAISHRPDMPLTPFDSIRVGLSLWNSISATLLVECVMFAAALWVYARITRARDAIGRWGLVGFVLLTLAIYVGSAFGSPPPSIQALAWTGNGQWLFIILAAWFDHHREVVS